MCQVKQKVFTVGIVLSEYDDALYSKLIGMWEEQYEDLILIKVASSELTWFFDLLKEHKKVETT